MKSAGWLRSDVEGLGFERVGEIQRRRMLTAMVEEAAERGASNVTVAHIVGRAGVSRRTFYEVFENREDCFLAAFDAGVARIAVRALPVFEREPRWTEGVRAGLRALLDLFEEDLDLGRLLVVEALGAGPRALEHRCRVVDAVVRAIDERGREAKVGRGAPPLTTEGVVGAVLSVLHARLLAERPGGFGDLVNPLMAMIVLPYLGRAAANRELGRPVEVSLSSGTPRGTDPLRDLGMRLTYRTVRVLLAVAANPGSSNRKIGDGSGIVDQGQISKLLARMQGFGLVENKAVGAAHGEPNAWTLTPKGLEVHSTLASQAPGA
jgi:AcrR family transcriptional regulator/DNA-binding MarR family transcriptional regulator